MTEPGKALVPLDWHGDYEGHHKWLAFMCSPEYDGRWTHYEGRDCDCDGCRWDG